MMDITRPRYSARSCPIQNQVAVTAPKRHQLRSRPSRVSSSSLPDRRTRDRLHPKTHFTPYPLLSTLISYQSVGCLRHVVTTIQQGNGGSDSGEIDSKMSLVTGHFEGEGRKENAREEIGSGEIEEDVVTSQNVGREVSVGGGDNPVVTVKSPTSSHTVLAVPSFQQKTITVDHEKKPAEEVKIANPELMPVSTDEAAKEKLENPVLSTEECVDLCEEAKEVAEHFSDVLTEKVNSLISGQPPSSEEEEEEEEVETLTSGLSPSEGKEENIEARALKEPPPFYETEGKVETFGSDQPPSIDKEDGVIASAQKLHGEGEQKCKLENSYLVEHVPSHNEEKVISLYDCAFSENMATRVQFERLLPAITQLVFLCLKKANVCAGR